MLVHCRVTPRLNSPVPIYTPGWREALWEWSVLPMNTTQCPRLGLEPGPLNLESSALTMRPLHLTLQTVLIPNCILRLLRHWDFIIRWKHSKTKQIRMVKNEILHVIKRKRNNLNVGIVSASQIKKLRKRFCWVEPTPLKSVHKPSPVQSSR